MSDEDTTDISEASSAPVEGPEAVAQPSADAPAEPPSDIDGAMRDVADRIEKRDGKNYLRNQTGQFGRKPATEFHDQFARDGREQQPTEQAPGPISWRNDMRERLASAPPELQAYVAEREHAAHAKISELGQVAKEARDIGEIAERYKDVVPEGMPRPVMIEYLLAAQKEITRDAPGAIRQLAENCGVDLRALVDGGAPQQAQAPEVDYQALAEVHAESIREAREEAHASALVEYFSETTPDFNGLEADVLEQVLAIRARSPDMPSKEVLTKAYERATRINDGYVQRRDSQKTQAETEVRARETQERVKRAADAKRLGSMNVKSVGSSSPRRGTWEDTLRDVGNRIAG